ncbi:hypothetical protein NCAS_0F01860 [Naumovozyma castellii]|uniref:Kinetochore protein Spc24 n=1 Tax=Naumovozyma castellii TaxID=27288 RepID=G0VGP9_NAUCA|nr:hypothetical protein NCAS_0F01860 [Naumovozyma castellii CBS 4309]CCC70670.1 hypothetical protein NCAS_0F01860 [Naumovozyma castellii CBS 4309]
MSDNEHLIENLAGLLRETRENFDIEPDVNSVMSFNEGIDQIDTRTKNLLSEGKSKNSDLINQIESQTSHLDQLSKELIQTKEESKNFKSKDQLIDFVKELDQLENTIVTMRGELDTRIVQLVSNDENFPMNPGSLDTNKTSKSPRGNILSQEEEEIFNDPIARANILRLKLYKSMGVILDIENNQVLINGQNNKIDTLPLDDDLSEYFKTKYIWERIKQSKK